MSVCYHRFLKEFYVDVHISKVTVEEATAIKAYVEKLKNARKI